MTSSPGPATLKAGDDLPQRCRRCGGCACSVRHGPGPVPRVRLSLLSALPMPARALAQAARPGPARTPDALLCAAAIGLSLSATATWFLRTVSTRIQRRFRARSRSPWKPTSLDCANLDRDHRAPRRPDYLDQCSRCAAPSDLRPRPCPSSRQQAGSAARGDVALLATIHPASMPPRSPRARPSLDVAAAVERVAQERGARPRLGVTSSRQRRRRRLAKRCASWASARAWSSCAGTPEQWCGPIAARAGAPRLSTRAVGGVRRRLRRRGRLRGDAPGLDTRKRAPRARGRLASVSTASSATVGDRIPSRILDGRLSPSCLAGRLRGVIRRGGSAVPAALHGHPSPSRLVRVSGDVAPRARRRLADPAAARRRHRRRTAPSKTTLVKLLAKM